VRESGHIEVLTVAPDPITGSAKRAKLQREYPELDVKLRRITR